MTELESGFRSLWFLQFPAVKGPVAIPESAIARADRSRLSGKDTEALTPDLLELIGQKLFEFAEIDWTQVSSSQARVPRLEDTPLLRNWLGSVPVEGPGAMRYVRLCEDFIRSRPTRAVERVRDAAAASKLENRRFESVTVGDTKFVRAVNVTDPRASQRAVAQAFALHYAIRRDVLNACLELGEQGVGAVERHHVRSILVSVRKSVLEAIEAGCSIFLSTLHAVYEVDAVFLADDGVLSAALLERECAVLSQAFPLSASRSLTNAQVAAVTDRLAIIAAGLRQRTLLEIDPSRETSDDALVQMKALDFQARLSLDVVVDLMRRHMDELRSDGDIATAAVESISSLLDWSLRETDPSRALTGFEILTLLALCQPALPLANDDALRRLAHVNSKVWLDGSPYHRWRELVGDVDPKLRDRFDAAFARGVSDWRPSRRVDQEHVAASRVALMDELLAGGCDTRGTAVNPLSGVPAPVRGPAILVYRESPPATSSAICQFLQDTPNAELWRSWVLAPDDTSSSLRMIAAACGVTSKSSAWDRSSQRLLTDRDSPFLPVLRRLQDQGVPTPLIVAAASSRTTGSDLVLIADSVSFANLPRSALAVTLTDAEFGAAIVRSLAAIAPGDAMTVEDLDDLDWQRWHPLRPQEVHEGGGLQSRDRLPVVTSIPGERELIRIWGEVRALDKDYVTRLLDLLDVAGTTGTSWTDSPFSLNFAALASGQVGARLLPDRVLGDGIESQGLTMRRRDRIRGALVEAVRIGRYDIAADVLLLCRHSPELSEVAYESPLYDFEIRIVAEDACHRPPAPPRTYVHRTFARTMYPSAAF